ncbi:MAG: hypothetical protein D6685_10570 [Bacteroidetes bacterium]|nr:MAG: hypothetical protein D6685_10570 [Bacteroidota bacterium]
MPLAETCRSSGAGNRACFGLWAVGFGLWAVGFGLWALGCGLWAPASSQKPKGAPLQGCPWRLDRASR